MARTELDKTIRKALGQRTIAPTSDAWERVQAGLPAPRRMFRAVYYTSGVAATIAGILILSFLYFQDSGVGETPESFAGPQRPGQEARTPQQPLADAPLRTEEGSQPGPVERQVATPEPGEIAAGQQAPSRRGPVVDSGMEPKGQTEEPPAADPAEALLIQAKVEEVVARVNAAEREGGQLADAEVEQLLRDARQEILAERSARQQTTVDAMALLSEVETDLNRSFRDQIFEKLKAGYTRVRTAIADRNN